MHPRVVRGMDLSQIKQPTTTHSSRKPLWLSSFSQNFSFSLLDQICAVDVFPKIRRRKARSELETFQKQTPESEELCGIRIHPGSQSPLPTSGAVSSICIKPGTPILHLPGTLLCQGQCPARTLLIKANNPYPEIRMFVV